MSEFSGRSRGTILVIAAVSLLATVISLLYGQRLREPVSIDTDSYSRGPIGHRALVELYEASGVHTLVDREGVYPYASAPVFFIEPLSEARRDGVRRMLRGAIKQRTDAGLDSVVVLPKWTLDHADETAIRVAKSRAQAVLDDALHYEYYHSGVELRREDLPIPATAMLREWTVAGTRGPRRVVLQERQVLRIDDGFAFEVLLGSEDTALIVRMREGFDRGSVIIVSDPDLLHNYNIQRGDHGQIAHDLLAELRTDTVIIDEVFHGHGFHLTLGAALGRFPAVLIVIQGLIVALLFALAGARSFGRERAPAPDRRSTVALIDLATRALLGGSRSRRITSSYVTRLLQDTAERLGVPEARSLETRARRIDRIAKLRKLEGGAEALVNDLALIDAARPRAQLALARRAYRLRQRLCQRARP